MFLQSSNKHKSKINPMDMDFDIMIKNHPEFFTKLSSQNFNHPRLPPASGGFSSRLPSSRPPSGADGYLARGLPPLAGGGGQPRRRVGGPGATLKPKIYPPTLIRNAKPKRGRNNFFK
jgi:hypothetical protein